MIFAIFGNIENPLSGGYGSVEEGLVPFLSNVLKLIAVAGGLFALINLVFAGIQYIGSSGDPQKTSQAWAKIYLSLIGLIVIVGSYALAAILGLLLFGSADAILSPTIYGPGSP